MIPRPFLSMKTAIFLLLMAAGTCGKSAELTPAEALLAKQRPLVIAHRGYSMVAPENTVPAFKLALTAAADLVELDYHHSKDGIPVVFHDFTLERTSDAGAKIAISEKTVSALQQLDAGKWFSANFVGTRIPTLEESLAVIQQGGVTLIERKAGEARTLAELLQQKKLVNQVIVQAFDWKYLADLHKLLPDQILGALGPTGTIDGRKLTDQEKQLSKAWIDAAWGAGARVVGWNKLIDAEAVRYAHEQEMEVWVYTLNDAPTIERILAMGVDGVITDNPALGWRVLAERNSAGK